MNKILVSALLASSVMGGMLAATAPAQAFGISVRFDAGNVAFGYQDGYWDNDHHWHRWHNRSEAYRYRRDHGDNYQNYRHTRAPGQGWHERGNDQRGNEHDRQDRPHADNAPRSPFVRDAADVVFTGGNVAFGYQDGYWDRGHEWHQWRNDDERRMYQSADGNRYNDYRHDRDQNQGWASVNLNFGEIAFGYQDGFWDRSHQWHQWRNDEERRMYRSADGNRYNEYRHDRDQDNGWHQ